MRFADRTRFAIRSDTNIAGGVLIVCSVESNISRKRSVMTFSAAVVIPHETGSKFEQWLESRAKELARAHIRPRSDEKGLERRNCLRFSIEGAAISYQNQKLLPFMMKVEERNCPVVDLSRGGMCFLNQKPLKLHSKVRLQLFTPDEAIPLNLEGRVRWSVRTPGKSYRYQAGVQFNAYGEARNQNAPHLLDSLVALETRFIESRGRSTSGGVGSTPTRRRVST